MNLRALCLCLGCCLALAATGCQSQKCTPSTSECLGSQAVLVCPSDGSGWTGYSCASWEICNAGACKAVDGIDVACTPGTAKCVNERVLSVCVATGVAPSVVACQEGEACADGACTSVATCTAGATECVSAGLMRTCAADGRSWVPSACASTDACETAVGTCVRRTDVNCTSADNACVGSVPFVCKKDGTGFETTPCPANTRCTGEGRCQGTSATGCVIGSSCSGDTVVACTDGKNSTSTQCAVGHSCVFDPVARAASCKEVVCAPGERECGNATDPTADLGGFASTCKADGAGWAVARCESGSVCAGGACVFDCMPGYTACSDNSVVACSAQGQWDLASVDNCGDGRWCEQATPSRARCADILCALSDGEGVCVDDHFRGCVDGVLQAEVECPGGCSGVECLASCVDGETRCSEDTITKAPGKSASVETCAGGKWPGRAGAVACNDPMGDPTPTVCVKLSELPGAHKAVCGDPECSVYRLACTSDGKVRFCEDGLLGTPQDCPTGTTCRDRVLGCWKNPCTDGEKACANGLSYVTCEGGQWSDTYASCGTSPTTGSSRFCNDTSDAAGLRTVLCADPGMCTPGTRQCSSDSLGVQTCQPDGSWGTVASCTLGACSPSDATCTAQCKPGAMICGGASITANGQPAMTKTGVCSASGRLPDWSTIPDCAVTTFCRTNAAGEAVGCVECLGSRLSNGFVDTRCYAPSPIATQVQFCGSSNTWASGAAATIDCGFAPCFGADLYSPAACMSVQ